MPWTNPKPTVDIVIRQADCIVLIRRRNPPQGWALPGGFVDVGETVESAACREAQEETGLKVVLESLLHVYSDPARDPRHHTISVVFVGTAQGTPVGLDDAAEARRVPLTELQEVLAAPVPTIDGQAIVFDHAHILRDYLRFATTGARPPVGTC